MTTFTSVCSPSAHSTEAKTRALRWEIGAIDVTMPRANGRNRARLVAGYCWNWASKKNTQLNDILIPSHNYSAQWNLNSEKNSWIISSTGVEEVGCIHTCQGLEVDTIGVIIGPDLIFRDGKLLTDPTARARTDSSFRGMKKAMKVGPDATQKRAGRLIRNTYRTLMSRGMKSCWVFACDKELQEYLKEKLNMSSSAE